MNILAAIRREERKLGKQVGKLHRQLDGLDGLKAATKALGNSAQRKGFCQRLQERRFLQSRKDDGRK
jgi:hypothetical protein